MNYRIATLSFICLFWLAGCSQFVGTPSSSESSSVPDSTESQAIQDSYPSALQTNEPGPAAQAYPANGENNATAASPDAYPLDGDPGAAYPTPESCVPESAGAQQTSFLSSDNLNLAGTYYPAANCNAPIVVLFHQFGSNKESWTQLALWLQNRSNEQSSVLKNIRAAPAMQYPWMPAMPDGLSFNVFTFDFRGHGESDSNGEGFDADGYLQDAKMAVAFAQALPFVSASELITIGASIGADASIDVCLLLEGTAISDFQQNQGCIGAMSLSPGSYLDIDYGDVAVRLSEPPFQMQIYCIASEQDSSAEICERNYPGSYTGLVYPGRGDHGIALLQDNLDPNIGDLILEFLLNSLASQ